eukprot:187377_1
MSFARSLVRLTQRVLNKNLFLLPSCAAAASLLTTTEEIRWLKLEDIDHTEERQELITQTITHSNASQGLNTDKIAKCQSLLHCEWEMEVVDDQYYLVREFNVQTFGEVMDIATAIFEVVDRSNYEPDFLIEGHKKVSIAIHPYRSKVLSVADFILAARIDESIEKLSLQYSDDD